MFAAEHRAIIERHQTGDSVNAAHVARDFGLRVFEADLQPGVSGKLAKDAKRGGASGFAIFVARHDAPVRKRFTVAHEIGHFLLHRKLLEDGEIVDDAFYRSRLSNQLEREANEAAAEILMPWSIIDAHVAKGLREPDDIAQVMRVSATAMRIRLGMPT